MSLKSNGKNAFDSEEKRRKRERERRRLVLFESTPDAIPALPPVWALASCAF